MSAMPDRKVIAGSKSVRIRTNSYFRTIRCGNYQIFGLTVPTEKHFFGEITSAKLVGNYSQRINSAIIWGRDGAVFASISACCPKCLLKLIGRKTLGMREGGLGGDSL